MVMSTVPGELTAWQMDGQTDRQDQSFIFNIYRLALVPTLHAGPSQQINFNHIKTHGSVSCSPRNLHGVHDIQVSDYFTGVKKMLFSRICSSILPEQKHEIFCVNSLGWDTSNSKFELNLPSCSRDMCLQSLSYFEFFFSFSFFSQHFLKLLARTCFNEIWSSVR